MYEPFGHLRRDGYTETLYDHRVDAHDPAVERRQRSAGVPRRESDVCAKPFIVIVRYGVSDAHAQCPLDPERMAEGDDDLPDPKIARAPEFCRDPESVWRVDEREQRQIHLPIAGDHPR
jgi:hypothetical protein